MNVVFALAAPFPSPQGTQVYVRGLARALEVRGHRVTVVAYDLGDGDPGVEVIRVPVPRGYRRLRSGPDRHKPWIDLGMAAVLSRMRADVVHAHHLEALAAALAARRRPLVYHAHTLLGEELPTYFHRFPSVVARLGGGADQLARLADAVVTVSAPASAVLSRLGCRDVTVVRPGLDAADFVGVEARRQERTLVYAGNSDRYQQVDVLLAAMAHLPGWRLRVLTHDPVGFPSGVDIVVTRSWQQARDYIARADVAALPRTLAGGSPVKLLNYLACGVPVVLGRALAQGLRGEVPVNDGDPVDFARGVLEASRMERRDWACELLETEAWDRRAGQVDEVYARVTSGAAGA